MSIIFSSTNSINSNGWQGYGIRQVVPLANLTNPGFNIGQIRVTLVFHSTTNAGIIDALEVGAGIISLAYYFDGSQVPLKFSGASSLAITGAQTVVTDWSDFTFNFSTAVSLVIAMHFSGTEVDARNNTTSSGNTLYYRSSAVTADTALSAPSGTYTTLANEVDFITLIEFQQISSSSLLSGYDSSRLQFVADALRTAVSPTVLDLTMEVDRRKHSTNGDILRSNGHRAIRNSDATGMTIAQIATAANLTSAQVQDMVGRI